ncbi:MAG: GNAT family N-acetyltransferase [Anaerolineae bacterium]|nr:GNAT family N-acetyltransferase [Anaerolineae bacterium]
MADASALPPPITLRPLTTDDAPALQGVYDRCADYFRLASGGAWEGAPPDQAHHDLAEAAQDDGRYLLGIYLAEELVGVIDLRLADPGPYDVRLGLIALAEPYRRQGLGRWALRILEEWLRRATPTEAVVAAVAANDYASQAFFRACGYTFSGQATRVAVGDFRLRFLAMRKSLRAP